MKTAEMEIALMQWYDQRQNLVVPNVSWGFKGHHEMDLVVLTKSGFLYEIEIKVSMSDLRADAHKSHGHRSSIVKYLYFAVPEKLWPRAEAHIPEHAGVLVVSKEEVFRYVRREEGRHSAGWRYVVRQKREPACTQHRKLTDREKFTIARLGALRVLGLKKSNHALKEENRKWRALGVV